MHRTAHTRAPVCQTAAACARTASHGPDWSSIGGGGRQTAMSRKVENGNASEGDSDRMCGVRMASRSDAARPRPARRCSTALGSRKCHGGKQPISSVRCDSAVGHAGRSYWHARDGVSTRAGVLERGHAEPHGRGGRKPRIWAKPDALESSRRVAGWTSGDVVYTSGRGRSARSADRSEMDSQMMSNVRRCQNWPRESVGGQDNGSARDVRRVEPGRAVCMAGTQT